VSVRQRQRPFVAPPASGDVLSHGMAMIAAPVALGFLGSFVDGEAGTGPVLLILFAMFGVAASFASAYYRYTVRMDRENEGKPWARTTRTVG
jgi:hypothetical protein